ncbi:uncharacterized protein LOC116109438 [Pistacia vera]|uniref:uncharacterized protein LOC116109438 n=1 Tax=Pistacia vera TaxID=55513 RepID=UPI0012630961|nr:uncharacterized protein LOC116109438 [Pistacia vera]
MNQKQHIEVALSKQSDQVRTEYRTCLTASIVSIRFLLRQGLAFRGHDETEDSKNQALVIQKDIVNVAANETTKAIISDLGDDIFSVLIDESRDVSIKEQMAITISYVDKKGHSQVNNLVQALEIGEVSKGRSLNQETSLKRAGGTRWGLYYNTLINLILLLFSVGDVLEVIEEDGLNPEQKGEAYMQLQELNTRFTEVSTELLLCMACLDPSNSFSAFDKHKLIRFAEFYPSNFSAFELMVLKNQIETYVIVMRSCDEFAKLQ